MALVTNASHATVASTATGAATAKTASGAVVASNRDRVSLYVSNTGANAVWLALGGTAELNKGIYLPKEGGGNQPLRIPDYTGAVAAITKEGESLLTFSEV